MSKSSTIIRLHIYIRIKKFEVKNRLEIQKVQKIIILNCEAHNDPNFASSHVTTGENFTNYFLKTKAKHKRFKVLKFIFLRL